MQLLGPCSSTCSPARRTLNILGATSGDTGSAAEYAMRGKRGVAGVHAVAAGRMSPFQQAQMFACRTPTSTTSPSRACSTIARTSSRPSPTTRRSRRATASARSTRSTGRACGAGRLLLQGLFPGDHARTTSAVDFAVPSGNFGNICAGHVARRMGLPIRRLVLATNENDVLDEFFRTGTLSGPRAPPRRTRPRARRWTSPRRRTSSASCSTCRPRRGAHARAVRRGRARGATFALAAAERARVAAFGFVCGRSTHADRLATIRDIDRRFGEVIDPHTADGLKVGARARRNGDADDRAGDGAAGEVPDDDREALGREPAAGAFARHRSAAAAIHVLPADVARLKAFIAANA